MSKQVSSKRLTEQVMIFRKFLSISWPFIDQAMKDHNWDEDVDFIDQWVQMNWHYLVGRELLGVDAKISSLFSAPDFSGNLESRNPDLVVVVNYDKPLVGFRKKKAETITTPLLLNGFSSFHDGGYGLYPPFDLACVRSKYDAFIVPVNEIEFHFLEWDQFLSEVNLS